MVQRWTTADIKPCETGGFVAYGDYLALAKLAKASLDARDKEARAAMAYENARNNFSQDTHEQKAYENAMIAASNADKALRNAL